MGIRICLRTALPLCVLTFATGSDSTVFRTAPHSPRLIRNSEFLTPLFLRKPRLIAVAATSKHGKRRALGADGAESALCAYLALVALVGLGINTIWHVNWVDPVAALAMVPLIIREGSEALASALVVVADGESPNPDERLRWWG